MTKAAVWASFASGVGITVANMIHPFIASPINAGAIAMIVGLILVPVVSLITPKPNKETFFSKSGDTVNLGRMTDKLYGFQRAVINEKEGMIEKQTGNLFIPNTRKSK